MGIDAQEILQIHACQQRVAHVVNQTEAAFLLHFVSRTEIEAHLLDQAVPDSWHMTHTAETVDERNGETLKHGL